LRFHVRGTELAKSVRVPLTKVKRLEYEGNRQRVRAKRWSFTPEPKADGLTFRLNTDGPLSTRELKPRAC